MAHKKFYTIAEIHNLFALYHNMKETLNDEGIINICKLAGTTPENRLKEVQDEIKWIFDHIDEETRSKVIKYVFNDLNYALGIYDELIDGKEKIYMNI